MVESLFWSTLLSRNWQPLAWAQLCGHNQFGRSRLHSWMCWKRQQLSIEAFEISLAAAREDGAMEESGEATLAQFGRKFALEV